MAAGGADVCSGPIERAEEIAGGVIYSLLDEMGDSNAGVGTHIVVAALVDAGAPLEKMVELAYLGRTRLKRHQSKGGPPIGNKPGYYINIMRNLSDEARREWWNIAKLEERDRRNHERAQKARQSQRQQGYHYH